MLAISDCASVRDWRGPPWWPWWAAGPVGGLKGFAAELLREGDGEEVEVTTGAVDALAAVADARGPVGMLLAPLGPVGGPEEGETEAAGPLVLVLLTELWREMPDQLFPPRPPRDAKPPPRGGT